MTVGWLIWVQPPEDWIGPNWDAGATPSATLVGVPPGGFPAVDRAAAEVGERARADVVVVALVGGDLGPGDDQLARVVGLVAADLARVDVVVVVDEPDEVEPGAALVEGREGEVERGLHQRVAGFLLAVDVNVARVPAEPCSGRARVIRRAGVRVARPVAAGARLDPNAPVDTVEIAAVGGRPRPGRAPLPSAPPGSGRAGRRGWCTDARTPCADRLRAVDAGRREPVGRDRQVLNRAAAPARGARLGRRRCPPGAAARRRRCRACCGLPARRLVEAVADPDRGRPGGDVERDLDVGALERGLEVAVEVLHGPSKLGSAGWRGPPWGSGSPRSPPRAARARRRPCPRRSPASAPHRPSKLVNAVARPRAEPRARWLG